MRGGRRSSCSICGERLCLSSADAAPEPANSTFRSRLPPGAILSSSSMRLITVFRSLIRPANFSTPLGPQGTVGGLFASPKSIAFDSGRNLYVTDALMDNLQIFDPAGSLLLIVGKPGTRDGEFSSPGGIAIGAGNRIYVVETLNRRIQVLEYLP